VSNVVKQSIIKGFSPFTKKKFAMLFTSVQFSLHYICDSSHDLSIPPHMVSIFKQSSMKVAPWLLVKFTYGNCPPLLRFPLHLNTFLLQTMKCLVSSIDFNHKLFPYAPHRTLSFIYGMLEFLVLFTTYKYRLIHSSKTHIHSILPLIFTSLVMNYFLFKVFLLVLNSLKRLTKIHILS